MNLNNRPNATVNCLSELPKSKTHTYSMRLISERFSQKSCLWFIGACLLVSLNFLLIPQVSAQLPSLPSNISPPNFNISQAGNLDVGEVRLDGKKLFSIGSPSSTDNLKTNMLRPIERRVKTINYHLASIVRASFDPQSLKIEISTLNGETVLVASDKNWDPRYLLTVTPYDVELDEPGTISSVAQRWQGIIDQALREEQRHYIRQQLPRLFAIMVAIGGLSIGILRLQRWRLQQNHRLHKQRRHQQASPPTTTASSADSFP